MRGNVFSAAFVSRTSTRQLWCRCLLGSGCRHDSESAARCVVRPLLKAVKIPTYYNNQTDTETKQAERSKPGNRKTQVSTPPPPVGVQQCSDIKVIVTVGVMLEPSRCQTSFNLRKSAGCFLVRVHQVLINIFSVT